MQRIGGKQRVSSGSLIIVVMKDAERVEMCTHVKMGFGAKLGCYTKLTGNHFRQRIKLKAN